ncbi:MAG: hypothetical protein KGL20_02415, partial [Rhodospirillales bacterium]|nr:hypothetical protein [Rhodospirillales bacterium]
MISDINAISDIFIVCGIYLERYEFKVSRGFSLLGSAGFDSPFLLVEEAGMNGTSIFDGPTGACF